MPDEYAGLKLRHAAAPSRPLRWQLATAPVVRDLAGVRRWHAGRV